MNIKLLFLIAFLISNSVAHSTTFNFLRDFSNARSSALAGSVISIENDLDVSMFNPALLYTIKDNNNFSVTFMKGALDINYGVVQYLMPFQWEGGKFAANVSYTNYGSFDYVDNLGETKGTYGANDMALSVNYANQIDSNIFYGVGLKFIYSNIEKYNSTGIALDAGILYQFPDGRTNLAASLLNFGLQTSTFDGVNEDLPNDLRIGFNHKLKGLPLLFNLSFVNLAETTDSFSSRFANVAVGGEFNISKYVDVRVGYNNFIRQAINNEVDKGLSGFSGGIGIKTNVLFLDYAISIQNSALNLHRITIKFNI